MKATKRVILAAVFALTMFAPSFQRPAKADPATTVITLVADAYDVFLHLDGIPGESSTPTPPPPPPPKKK